MVDQIVLSGSTVNLAVPDESHVANIVAWLNDLEVIPGASSRQLHTVESATVGPSPWFTEALQAGEGSLRFIVVAESNGRPVGTTELFNIDHRLQTAEFGIIMGERGLGFGKEATRLTLDWAINVLGMQNVMLRVGSWHESAIHVYEANGFKHIGRRRNAYRFAGKIYDEVWMDLIPEDLTEFSSSATAGLPRELQVEP